MGDSKDRTTILRESESDVLQFRLWVLKGVVRPQLALLQPSREAHCSSFHFSAKDVIKLKAHECLHATTSGGNEIKNKFLKIGDGF